MLLEITQCLKRDLVSNITDQVTLQYGETRRQVRDDGDDYLKKDIHTRGSSSYKNSGLCSFDVSKNICQILCHTTICGWVMQRAELCKFPISMPS